MAMPLASTPLPRGGFVSQKSVGGGAGISYFCVGLRLAAALQMGQPLEGLLQLLVVRRLVPQ